MEVGVQLEAPEGWGSFRKGTRYYFVCSRSDIVDAERVETMLFAWFVQSTKSWQKWRVHTMKPTRADIEKALLHATPKLRVCEKQSSFPPWLSELEGTNFDSLQEIRVVRKFKNTYRQEVEARLLKISPALARAEEILSSDKPLREISQAVKFDQSCHPHRAQLWFFAFLLHGRNIWALKPPGHRRGKWDRESEEHKEKKFGRPSLHGMSFGWSMAGLRKKFSEWFLKYVNLGVTMKAIHRRVLIEQIGCVAGKDDFGREVLFHPNNKPFPTYGQFRYGVIEDLGLDYVQIRIYGRKKIRNKSGINNDNQTGQYRNILEELQVDAYQVLERPKSVNSDEPTDALIVAAGVCVGSAATFGVGFSLGSENGEAYRSMLFCMAVEKNYIADLYGIPPHMLNWKMQGLPPAFNSDRGPAGGRKFAERLEKKFPIKSIAPSNDGRAKAVVETNHPKNIDIEESPSYLISELNVVQMIKREIIRAAAKNHSKDISSRLSDQEVSDFHRENRVATPHEYYDYMNIRLRTCARQMSLEDAVRTFWTPIKLKVDCDGVRFRHRHYNSAEFLKCGVMKMIGRGGEVEVQGYTLSLVFRKIWVEVRGKMIEVVATRRVRTGDDDMLVPITELAEIADKLAIIRSQTRVSGEAAKIRGEIDFKKLTNKDWGAAQRKGGSPPRATGTTLHEAKIARGAGSKR